MFANNTLNTSYKYPFAICCLIFMLSACGGGSESNESTARFIVQGVATGVLEPVTIELTSAKGIELLTLPDNGAFSFDGVSLIDGDSYSVTVAGTAPCRVVNNTGVINKNNAEIQLQCLLADLAVSGLKATAQGQTEALTEYTAQLSLLIQDVSVTAVAAAADVEITVNGTALASGEASAPIVLDLGDTLVNVTVSHLASGWMKTYPLQVSRGADILQAAYGKASNTDAGDNFGYSVSLSGDTLAVGASGAIISNGGGEDSAATGINGDQSNNDALDSGAVYMFRRIGSTWQQEAYIKASNTGAGDFFGHALSLSGDTLAISAIYEDSNAIDIDGDQNDNTAIESGAVYVFQRSGSSWQQQAYIKASNTGAGDNFGKSLSLSGDTLAVGAIFEDSGASGINVDEGDTRSNTGAVYVFKRAGSIWQQEAYVKASNVDADAADDMFGVSVSLSGDTLAVGAIGEDSSATGINGVQSDDSAGGSGAVYVFQRTGTTWQQQAYLKAFNTENGDEFGASISLSGDTLAVAALREDNAAIGVQTGASVPTSDTGTADDSGAVYVFQRTGATWQQQAYIKAFNTEASDEFGASTALSGDTLAVGAIGEDNAARGVQVGSAVPITETGTAFESGAVYVFRRASGTWQQDAYLKTSRIDSAEAGRFGTSISLSGDTLVTGSPLERSSAIGIDSETSDSPSPGVASSLESGAVNLFH